MRVQDISHINLASARPYTKEASFCYFERQKKNSKMRRPWSIASEAEEARFIWQVSSALMCKGRLHAKF